MSYAPRTHWDRFYRDLFQSDDDLDWGDQWTAPFVGPIRRDNVRDVLDLGCGSGNDVFTLTTEGFYLTGLDYSQEAIARARSRSGSAAHFVVADMARYLPFSDESFDAVMSNVAAHMFSDSITRGIFAEVRRILRREGLFLFHLNSTVERGLRKKAQVREIEDSYILEEDGQTVRFFSKEYLVELLSEWRSVEIEPVVIPDWHTGAPFKHVWRGIARR